MSNTYSKTAGLRLAATEIKKYVSLETIRNHSGYDYFWRI